MKFPLLAFLFSMVSASAVTITTVAGCSGLVSGITSNIPFTGPASTDPAGHATYTGSAYNQGTNPCGSDFLSLDGQTATILFDAPIDYFGLAWGTSDTFNSLKLFNGSTQIGPTYSSSIPGSFSTTYVNFFADSGEQFTSVVLSSSQCCFETDNHSYRLASSASPEPNGLLLVGVSLGLTLLKRRL